MKPELGVCYYPEHWPQDQWAEDAKLMYQTGIRWVRIGEFAWSRLEPKPGEFHWQWLDQAIEVLAAENLKIVLGTPTATPPRWMFDKYPDMIALDQAGQARGFGSRRHYDFSHWGYRQESARICILLAQRYGFHPAIAFWQVDNEYSCHDTTLSYSPAALTGFQRWLTERYHSIEKLNEAWGNVFWSMEYDDFQEIALPNLTVTEANPAHWHDFRRYSSEQVALFNRAQVQAIREHDSDTPILHNYMGRITDFDHFVVGEDLDAASWDSYPLGFLEDRSDADKAWKQRFMRQGDPDFQAFHHDLYRAVGKGRWWVMEQQPGPVNWAPHNPAPLPGMVRLWTWEAIAHGAEVVSYFRWRQVPFAQEQMHAGLLRPDSKPSFALAEVQQVAQELAAVEMEQIAQDPRAQNKSPIAIVFDYESAWAWDTQPQGQDFNYFKLIFEQYRALRQLGLSIGICPSDTTDFSDYALVLVPGLMYWKDGLKQTLLNYSGPLLIGPRTGSKDQNFAIPKPLPPNCPELLDLCITHVESLRPDYQLGLEQAEGHEESVGNIRSWCEYLEPGTNVETLLRSEDQQPVLVKQNNVHYLAAQLDLRGYQCVMSILCQDAGLDTVKLPEGLRLRQWGEETVVFNYNSHAVDLGFLNGVYDLSGQRVLEGAGVAWLRSR